MKTNHPTMRGLSRPALGMAAVSLDMAARVRRIIAAGNCEGMCPAPAIVHRAELANARRYALIGRLP